MDITLETAIKRENNNFDLIRMITSVAVVFGHSFILFPNNGYVDPVKALLIKDYSGSLAVFIFFFLSGVFITSSFTRSKSVLHFISMRFFRIWPALIVCILITIFIVGPIFTNIAIKNYFAERQTWKYFIKNILLIRVVHLLPGVFAHNYFNKSINGSLWTLFTEVRCYLMILILGLCKLLKYKATVIIVFVILVLCRHNHFFIYFIDTDEGVKQVLFFFSGMVCYTFRSQIIISNKFLIALIIVCATLYFINFYLFLYSFYILLIYFVLVSACSRIVKRLKLPGDYSYGIYVYGFLVQQIISHLFPGLTSYISMLTTIPLIILCGIFSWHFIELPSMQSGKTAFGKL